MIDLMMNERKYIEDVLRTGNINVDAVARDVSTIVRYCYHCLGMRRSKIIEYVDGFMYKHYPDYNPFQWHTLIEKYIRKAPGRKLIEINSVPITENEINRIKQLSDVETEKCLFTMLVIAKYKELAFHSNGWVSEKRDEIFRTANSKVRASNRNLVIHKLYLEGFIELSHTNKKENWKIPFMDFDGATVISINSTINCGLQYLMHNGDKKISICKDCGQFFVKLSNSSTRCRKCQALIDASKTKATY